MGKNVIIIIGNIGSGKTTITKKYVDKGYISINRDGLRYFLGAGDYIFNKKYEDIIFETELEIYRKFLKLGVNIVVDGANMTCDLRRDFIFYAKEVGYKIIGIRMPKYTKKMCVDRRLSDPHGNHITRKIWENVWDHFDRIYESMSLKEGFDEIQLED